MPKIIKNSINTYGTIVESIGALQKRNFINNINGLKWKERK
jgi:hypothetical protein